MLQTRQDSYSSDVVADFNYFPALGKPIPKSAWKARYLGDSDEFTRSMIVRDVRTRDDPFELDTNGFQFVQLPLRDRVSSEDDEGTVKNEYYPELERVAMKLYTMRCTYLDTDRTDVFHKDWRKHGIRLQSCNSSARLAV